MKEKIEFIKLKDIIIISAVIFIGLAGLLIPRLFDSGGVCSITLDGKKIYSARLSKETDKVFTLEEAPDFVFEIKNHEIRIVQSPCHDKICVHTGFIGRPGQAIVCLPNKLVVKIEADGADSGADLIIG
jgi:hypothetical protein